MAGPGSPRAAAKSAGAAVDAAAVQRFVEHEWYQDVVPTLEKYIKIPNLSPYFTTPDNVADLAAQDKAFALLEGWVRGLDVRGMVVEKHQLEGRTPLLFVEVAATPGVDVREAGTVLLYGHMDKQPPFTDWEEGTGPYEPRIKDGKLYGRGGADDGYAVFCALTAIRGCQKQGLPHARMVVIIEACEESGSPDLPAYIVHLKAKIGTPNLVVCLDSGAGNYEQLWVTTSLRGVCVGNLTVELTSEGVHSGDASGIVPDTFRVARTLLDRLEDSASGRVKLASLHAPIPEQVRLQVHHCAQVLGREGLIDCFPFLPGAQHVQVPEATSTAELLTELALNRWWRPQLAVIGAAGLPPAASAGNVLRPSTTLALSIRLPPALDTKSVQADLRDLLTRDAPLGAKVSFTSQKCGRGWAAPPLAPWLETISQEASRTFYKGKDCMYMGEGGSIPFMAMLGELYPSSQFLILGCLGPHSNAHGPNEFLHLEFSAKLTMCVTYVLAKHCSYKVDSLLQQGPASPQAKKAKTGADPADLTANFGRTKDGVKL